MQNGRLVGDWTADEFAGIPEIKRADLGLRALCLDRLRATAVSVSANTRTTLKVSGLTASYKRGQPILRDVTLAASSGDVIGVIGKNGQGKSTLARVLCGLHKESGGRVEIDGKPLSGAKRTEQFYLVMQDSNYQLFTDSVEGELKLSKTRKEQPEDEKIQRIMDDLSLAQYKDRHPMSLSGGQKQRCAIGVALARDARVIIFDEPTSGLDYRNMTRVCGVIRDLQKQGKIILIITHDYELLLAACTRVVELCEGAIARDEPLNEKTTRAIKPFFISF